MCRMLPEEIGCTLSHQTCYRRMVAEGIPYALILEDDLTMPRTEEGIVGRHRTPETPPRHG